MSNPKLTSYGDPVLRYLEWMFVRKHYFNNDDALIKKAYPKANWQEWRDAFAELPDQDPARVLFWTVLSQELVGVPLEKFQGFLANWATEHRAKAAEFIADGEYRIERTVEYTGLSRKEISKQAQERALQRMGIKPPTPDQPASLTKEQVAQFRELLDDEYSRMELGRSMGEPLEQASPVAVEEPDDDQPDNMAIMQEWQEAKRNGEDISLPEFIARKYGNAEPHTTEEPERRDPDAEPSPETVKRQWMKERQQAVSMGLDDDDDFDVVEPEPNPQPSYTSNAKAKAAPKPSRQRAKAKSGEGFVEGPLHDNLIAMIKKLNTQGKSVDEIEVEFHKYIEAHRAELSDAQANTLFQQAVKVLRGISRVSGVEGALLNPPTPNLRSRYKSAYFLWGHIKSNYSRIGNFAMSDAQASAWAGVSKGANLLEVIKVLTEDVKALKVVDRKQPQKDGGMATEYKRLV